LEAHPHANEREHYESVICARRDRSVPGTPKDLLDRLARAADEAGRPAELAHAHAHVTATATATARDAQRLRPFTDPRDR
jgi:hypothetical protein